MRLRNSEITTAIATTMDRSVLSILPCVAITSKRTVATKSDTMIAELQRRNLVRIGLAAEFTSIARHQHAGKDLLEVGLGIIAKMTNQCREMKRLPREQQATFPNI